MLKKDNLIIRFRSGEWEIASVDAQKTNKLGLFFCIKPPPQLALTAAFQHFEFFVHIIEKNVNFQQQLARFSDKLKLSLL